jgi:hypothetical protein
VTETLIGTIIEVVTEPTCPVADTPVTETLGLIPIVTEPGDPVAETPVTDTFVPVAKTPEIGWDEIGDPLIPNPRYKSNLRILSCQ